MPSIVHLNGVVQKTWAWQGNLYARISEVAADGSTRFYNLAFPREPGVVLQTDPFTTLRTTITPREVHGVQRGAWVFVNGVPTSRDERVPVETYLARVEGGHNVRPELRDELKAAVGAESRSQIDFIVCDIAIVRQVNLRESRPRGSEPEEGPTD